MPDNTATNPGTGGDTIATDDLTTLNGGASTGVKVQRVKVMFGDDGIARDASQAFPFPVYPSGSGRVLKVFSGTFTGAATEALISLTPITDGVAGTAATSFVVTSGKRFRIQAMTLTIRNAGAAVQGSVVNLRVNTAGAATAASALLLTAGAGTLSATANIVGMGLADVPDGLEILGNGTIQFGVSQVGTATAGNTITLVGYEY